MSPRYLIVKTAAGVVAGVVTAAVGIALTAAPAAAAKPHLVAVGLGGYSATADGLQYQGHLSGDPFGGDFTGATATEDGTLPAVGECEAGHATLRVEDERERYYELLASGQICGLYLPLGTMQRFTGRWTVSETNVRRLTRAKGFLDVRLLNGESDIYATE